MQPDRGLVEDVEDADEAGADLRGQSNALRFAARERAGPARERQVGQADVHEEGQAGLDLAEDGGGDRAGTALKLDVREECTRVRDRHVGELGDRQAADAHGQDFRLQPRPVAGRAWGLAHVGVEFLADRGGLRLVSLAFDVVDRAFEARRVGAFPAPPVAELDAHLVVLTVQDRVLDLLRQVLPRGAQSESEFLGQGFQELHVVAVVGGPWDDRTLGEGKLLIGDDQLWVDLEAEAQAGAIRARTVGRVEGERPRLDLVEGERVMR